MPLAFESPPLSEAVLLQVTTERRGAALTGSSFSMPPDQCTGTADDLMNNTWKRLPVTLPVVQYKADPLLPLFFQQSKLYGRS